jgi:predicted transcriptional regulator
VRTASFKLPESLDDALTELARRRYSKRSAIVREALEGLVRDGQRSATALVDELVGTLEGPSDLSTNPKHMRGYGK